jgi:hypothetical protein
MAKVVLLRVEIRLSTIGLRGTIIRAISTLHRQQTNNSCSENVRFWHKADILGSLATRPLLGVKQTFPAMEPYLFVTASAPLTSGERVIAL